MTIIAHEEQLFFHQVFVMSRVPILKVEARDEGIKGETYHPLFLPGENRKM